MTPIAKRLSALSVIALFPLLAACGGNQAAQREFPDDKGRGKPPVEGTIFSGENSLLDYLSEGDDNDGSGGGLGVNAYLWRATLDTVAFMPIASADPFGGTILTDWYSPPGTTDEQVKLNVLILDKALRADGLKVSVFRRARAGEAWVDQAVSRETSIELENTILTRARELRQAALLDEK
ncbi:MAG: DUF3576 domain-containing protein [Alphaproteobacteria bacterium]